MKTTGNASADGNTKDVKIAVPSKYFSNFGWTLQILLINCEIILTLSWSADWVTSSGARPTRFAITDTKLYVPAVALSKLLLYWICRFYTKR